MTGGWYTSPAWLRAHDQPARRFVGAIYETARWANANHASSGKLLQKYAKVDPAVAAQMTRTDFAESLTPELIQPSLDWAYRVNFVDRRLSASDIIG
jgi:ABC-type nitrate/sulfonate/bicarbonate transport system substrate-binding protein